MARPKGSKNLTADELELKAKILMLRAELRTKRLKLKALEEEAKKIRTLISDRGREFAPQTPTLVKT